MPKGFSASCEHLEWNRKALLRRMWRRNSVKKDACTPLRGAPTSGPTGQCVGQLPITSPGSPVSWKCTYTIVAKRRRTCRNNWVSEDLVCGAEPPTFYIYIIYNSSVPARSAHQFGRILPAPGTHLKDCCWKPSKDTIGIPGEVCRARAYRSLQLHRRIETSNSGPPGKPCL